VKAEFFFKFFKDGPIPQTSATSPSITLTQDCLLKFNNHRKQELLKFSKNNASFLEFKFSIEYWFSLYCFGKAFKYEGFVISVTWFVGSITIKMNITSNLMYANYQNSIFRKCGNYQNSDYWNPTLFKKKRCNLPYSSINSSLMIFTHQIPNKTTER
jgi:hypothetical protein